MSTLHFALPEVAATDAAGAALARALAPDLRGLITLEGDLGAGKTALARAVLRGLGVTGPVKSPTYTLVEPYVVVGGRVLHLDLYRLGGGGGGSRRCGWWSGRTGPEGCCRRRAWRSR